MQSKLLYAETYGLFHRPYMPFNRPIPYKDRIPKKKLEKGQQKKKRKKIFGKVLMQRKHPSGEP